MGLPWVTRTSREKHCYQQKQPRTCRCCVARQELPLRPHDPAPLAVQLWTLVPTPSLEQARATAGLPTMTLPPLQTCVRRCSSAAGGRDNWRPVMKHPSKLTGAAQDEAAALGGDARAAGAISCSRAGAMPRVVRLFHNGTQDCPQVPLVPWSESCVHTAHDWRYSGTLRHATHRVLYNQAVHFSQIISVDHALECITSSWNGPPWQPSPAHDLLLRRSTRA